MSEMYDIPGFGGTATVNLTIASGVTAHGEYDPLHAYVAGDSVSYLGSSYIAMQDTTGNLPTVTTYWQVLATGAGSNVVISEPASGEHKVKSIQMDADEKIMIRYESAAQS